MEGPVSGRRIKRRTIRTVLIIAGVVIALVAVISTVTYISGQMAEKKQVEQTANLQAITGQLAETVSAPVLEASAQIDKLLQDEKVISLFAAGDIESLQAAAEGWAAQISHALKIRVFLPGQYREDRESSPPLGFASLDLLSQAEKSYNKQDVEVHGFNSPDAHLVLIRRVQDADSNLLGLIHFSLEVDPFITLEDTGSPVDGYTELVQLTGRTPLVLNKLGNAQYRKGSPASSDIKGTRWRIDYWSKSSVASGSDSGADAGGSLFYIIALLAVLGLAGGFLYTRRNKRIEISSETETGSNSIVYGGAVKAIMDGLHPGLERLIPNLPKMGQQKSIKPVSQGMEGTDITMVAKPEVTPDQIKPATAPPVKKPAPQNKPAPKDTKPGQPPARTVDSEAITDEVVKIPEVIFRAYDIRGVVGKTLTVNGVAEIGKAIGSEAKDRGQVGIAVGHDGRVSSQELSDALIRGLQASGIDVIDIGLAPTPVLYFATYHLETHSGVMVTGSHNGPEYNGLKIVLDSETLSGDAIQSIRQRIEGGNFTSGQGGLQTADITADYIRRATEDIPVALSGAFKIVVDCGNGVAGGIAPQLYRALGHDVVELYCDIDGKFPNHHPDPSQPANLQALISKVKETQADIGFAFDGDGDRLGVVDGDGNILWPDRQMMLFAKDVLSRNQGAQIIYDVKCSRHLKTVIEENGGQPVMWKTGHSLIKSKLNELNAPLAGEMSGHIFFKERWYGFDDAMYAGARMLEILAHKKMKPAEVFAELPGGVATPELRIPLPEKHHKKFMQALLSKASFQNAEITDIDGLRADFPEGWGLIRPSNTSPCLVARFEAEDEASLKKIQNDFRELIRAITPDLKLPF